MHTSVCLSGMSVTCSKLLFMRKYMILLKLISDEHYYRLL